MKGQKHNEGELKEVTIKIEKKVAEDLEIMSQNSKMSMDEIVVIALKRFKTSHGDYMGDKLSFE